jgi:hypothetical protein
MFRQQKTIKIFLIDGESTGRLSVELSNWTGKAYKVPRNRLKACQDRPELNGAGVYFLFGKDDDGSPLAYIGESEEVLKRLDHHLKHRDFWNEVVILISKDDNLNKAHVKYLEHHFYQRAKKIDRYRLANDTIPTRPSLSESDQAEMEEFMYNSMLLIGTLGHRIFEEAIDQDQESLLDENKFYIQAVRGAEASMLQTSEGFVVLKGSSFGNPVVSSFPPSYIKLREKMIEQEILKLEDNRLILQNNYVFTSPSTAAAMVLGRNANGLTEWKLQTGQTLRDFERIGTDTED